MSSGNEGNRSVKMPLQFPHKRFIINWLKALILSPGILFPTAYLLVYLSTSIYLNNAFKTELYQSIDRTSGNMVTIKVESISPNLQLDTMTLRSIDVIPAEHAESNESNNQPLQHIKSTHALAIRCPNLQQLLFNKEKRRSSITVISTILLAKHSCAQ